jgi:hypothetical protein
LRRRRPPGKRSKRAVPRRTATASQPHHKGDAGRAGDFLRLKARHQTVRPAPCAHGSSSQILMHMGPVFFVERGLDRPHRGPRWSALPARPPAEALIRAVSLPDACAVAPGLDKTCGPDAALFYASRVSPSTILACPATSSAWARPVSATATQS